MTFLTKLLGEENKLQQSLQKPRSGHRDTSTGPRGGSGPVSSHLASPAPRVCPGRAAHPYACLPNCEHRRQSSRVTSRLLSPHGAPAGRGTQGCPCQRWSHRSQRKTAVCHRMAGKHQARGVAHGGLLAGALQGTSHPPEATSVDSAALPSRPQGQAGRWRWRGPASTTNSQGRRMRTDEDAGGNLG